MPDITSDRVKLIVSLYNSDPLNGTEQTAIAQAGITKKTSIADIGIYTKTLDYATWVYANTAGVAIMESLTGNWNSVYSSVVGASGGWNYAYNNFMAPYTYVTNLTSNKDILSPHITLGTPMSAKYVDYSPLNIIDASTLSVFGSIQNTVPSASASSDLYIANDTGLDYLDIGVNSSQYDGTRYSPVFDIVKANDSYVYTLTANLAVGTSTAYGDLLLFTGGTQASNERMRVTSTGNIGIGTSTPSSRLSVVGDISSNGIITDLKGNSNNWNSVYSKVNSTSANWDSVYSSYNGASGKYESVYSKVNTTSANWDSVYSYVNANTGNWNSVYTSYNSVSGKHESVYSYVNANTANWNSISFLQSASANNASVYSKVNTTSANWSDVYDYVNANKGNWNSTYFGASASADVYSAVSSLSGSWSSVYSKVSSTSANWSSVYSYVNANTGNWNSISFLQSASANNASVYSKVNSASANWDSVYSYVNPNTANWNSISFLQSASANNASVYSKVNNTSANWVDTRTTVQSFSTQWIGNVLAPLNIQSGTSYTFSTNDSGYTICSTNLTTGLTASVGTGTYPDGFQVTLLQLGTQRIALSGGTNGITINQADGLLKTNKQYSAATLLYAGSTGGWILFGDLGA
jgi:hypothetical protein